MKFFLEKSQKKKNSKLVYRGEDNSFDTEPLEENGHTSIMINNLQLEIDDEGRIIYVWGYCPLIHYIETEEFPYKYISKTLVSFLNKPITPGVSFRINEKEKWSIFINKKRGWICIGNPKTLGAKMVEFLPNCIAALVNDEIISIWLKPEKLPNLVKRF